MNGIASVLQSQTPPALPANARQILTDKPIERMTMPRGVYDRKAKGEKKVGDKPKRKYTRKPPAAADLKSLTLASLLLTAAHLEATVRDQVEIGDNPELTFALDSFAHAKAIYEAA